MCSCINPASDTTRANGYSAISSRYAAGQGSALSYSFKEAKYKFFNVFAGHPTLSGATKEAVSCRARSGRKLKKITASLSLISAIGAPPEVITVVGIFSSMNPFACACAIATSGEGAPSGLSPPVNISKVAWVRSQFSLRSIAYNLPVTDAIVPTPQCPMASSSFLK